jgi:pilus assembly protein CpaE
MGGASMPEKILVVDDDLDTLRLVGLMLQRQGYEILAAPTGNQALVMAQSERPDLILLDVMMPDMDGFEVTRRLRAMEITSDIPIIMFTAKTQVEDKLQGFEVGADDYLTKPTQPRELFAHVKAVLSRTGRLKAVTTPSKDKGMVVGITSVRGGLGVTTLALNLSIAVFQSTRKSVILSDFRPGQGTLGLELGYLKPEGLSRLLHKKPQEIDEQAVETELIVHTSGIKLLLASPQPREALNIGALSNFETIARQLSTMGQYLFLDLGPSITPMVEKVIQLCDMILVVVEPVPQSVYQTKLLIEDLAIRGVGEGRVQVVLINRIRSGLQITWSQVQEQLGKNVVAIFTPAPELAYQASINNLPMILQQSDSITNQQFYKLAEKVTQRG